MIDLDRRTFLTLAGAAAVAPSAAAQPASGDMLIVNALGALHDFNVEVVEAERRTLSDRIIADARGSGLDAVNITLGFVAGDAEAFEFSLNDIDRWEAILRSRPDDLTKVLTAGDILRARREGKIGIIYGFQNAVMLAKDIERVGRFADLGVRVIQLTYNPANALGDGSMAPENEGLTDFGLEVVERLNAHRIMVDLSHSGERTCLDAARASRAPISINHTGCRALVDLPRNKSDEELRLVASRGGFVGIYFMPFLSPDSVATAADVVAHIDHAVNVCGEDHVGIGTDGVTTGIDDWAAFRAATRRSNEERRNLGIAAAGENPDTLPLVEELTGPGQYRRLIGLLERRGYPARRIEKIMSLNFVAFAREIWG